MVNRNNIDKINNMEMLGGFRLNPDSFAPMVSKGVRVIRSGHSLHNSGGLLGKLIVATRNSLDEKTFDPIYSIRQFAIWWHRASTQSNADQLLCESQKPCAPRK